MQAGQDLPMAILLRTYSSNGQVTESIGRGNPPLLFPDVRPQLIKLNVRNIQITENLVMHFLATLTNPFGEVHDGIPMHFFQPNGSPNAAPLAEMSNYSLLFSIGN
jgi:hypothetical protein